MKPAAANPARGFTLAHDDGHLELRGPAYPRVGAVYADWHSEEQRRRIAAGRRQPLARACGLHRKADVQLLDATAGLGRDGYTLAALGARVTLIERQPLVAALLLDALHQARDAVDAAASRLEVAETDAFTQLQSPQHWDVIYLDPMYPDDGRRALPSKEMQLLRGLAGGDEDADRLLAAALARARRVVVKRPLKGAWLAAQHPQLSLRATQLRYDIYLNAAMPPARSAGPCAG